MGQGRYRMLPTGNAEVTCEFPDSMLMISVRCLNLFLNLHITIFFLSPSRMN